MLTATRNQTASLLGVSLDTVDNLIRQGRLRRTAGNRYVHITLESIAEYAQVPLHVVIEQLRTIPRHHSEFNRTASAAPFPSADSTSLEPAL